MNNQTDKQTNKTTYCGVIVPMITPLNAKGAIDEEGVNTIVRNLVENQCSPFVAGTTGESSSIGDSEKADLVKAAVAANKGRELLYAGIADNCLEASLNKARLYKDLGADVVVTHLPSYYPLDEAQMKACFLTLADKSPLPVMLYNIPVTTHMSVPLSLVDELSYHENIVGLKDSERGDDRLREGLGLWAEREDFTFHLGWAAMSSYGLKNGLDGIVPSSANLVPGLYRGIYDAAKSGDFAEADRLQAITDEISEYYQKDQILSRSVPIFKAMLAAFEICEPYAASPMLTLSERELGTVRKEVLERFGQYVR
jgi:dihydrodipicolinate synthase/N-acetylneuraminate lyase